MHSLLALGKSGRLHSSPRKTVVKENIPRHKTLISTSYRSFQVEGEMAYFLSKHNMVERCNLSQPSVPVPFPMPRMWGLGPIYLGHPLSRLYSQRAALKDEALSSGRERKLTIKDVNSPRPVFLGCDANLHWVHIVSAWVPLHGPCGTCRTGEPMQMLMILILLTVLLASRESKQANLLACK